MKREVEQELFVAVNYDYLATEMARGSGEYLHALAELMGCPIEKYGPFAEAMQTELDTYLASSGRPAEAVRHLRTSLATHPTLNTCTRLS